jgi:hydrogenase/urease accessory protein HupE
MAIRFFSFMSPLEGCEILAIVLAVSLQPSSTAHQTSLPLCRFSAADLGACLTDADVSLFKPVFSILAIVLAVSLQLSSAAHQVLPPISPGASQFKVRAADMRGQIYRWVALRL